MKKILIIMTLLMSIMAARNYDIVSVPYFTDEFVKQSKEYEEKHDKKETEQKHKMVPTTVFVSDDGTIAELYETYVGNSCIQREVHYYKGEIVYEVIYEGGSVYKIFYNG